MNKLNLAETHSELLFEFIKIILPENANLADTYYKFKKSFKYDLISETKLCHICHKELKNKICPSKTCISNNNAKQAIPKSVKIIIADIKQQLDIILTNHYQTIVEYKSILNLLIKPTLHSNLI